MSHLQPFLKSRSSWISLFAMWLISIGPAICVGEDETVDRLLTDYREYGLPLPSHEAQLVLRQHSGSIVNGVPQYSYDLALQDKQDGKTVHWLGMSPEKPSGTVKEST